MKRTHRGFTLVELLIVVAVIGVLATMMTMSSSDAVDSAGANTILANLNSMKTAVYQLYMENAAIGDSTMAAKTQADATIKFGDAKAILAGALGKLAATETIGISTTDGKTTGKYDLIGNATNWFVVYRLDASDSAGVRTKLALKAADMELYGTAAPDVDTAATCGFTAPYAGTEEKADYYIAMSMVMGAADEDE